MGYERFPFRSKTAKVTHRAASLFEFSEVPEIEVVAVTDDQNSDCTVRRIAKYVKALDESCMNGEAQ